MPIPRVSEIRGAESDVVEVVPADRAELFFVSREVLYEMMDRARREETDNDDILDTTRGLFGVEDQGSGGVW